MHVQCYSAEMISTLWRATLIWFGILLLACANEIACEFLIPPSVSVQMGHVIRMLWLSGLIVLTARLSARWVGAASGPVSWVIGMEWMALMIAFEFLVGHYVFDTPWRRLLADYDLREGSVWVLVPFTCLLAPVWARTRVPHGAREGR